MIKKLYNRDIFIKKNYKSFNSNFKKLNQYINYRNNY